MVQYDNGLFCLNTDNTTYVFLVGDAGQLEHLYYGDSIDLDSSCVEAISEKCKYPAGNLITYSKEHEKTALENIKLEMSGYGKGDIREPFIQLKNVDGSYTQDFIYDSFEIVENHKPIEGLPSSYSNDGDDSQTLTVCMKSREYKLNLKLNYTVYPHCDCIVRSSLLENYEDTSVVLDRLMSCQLDIDNSDMDFCNWSGAWAREMKKNCISCIQGKIVNSSVAGTSSNRNNPFVVLADRETNDDYGQCFGFNLLYSGNHYECAEVNAFGKTRVVTGINPDMFQFEVKAGDTFQTPEAVMTYSSSGFKTMSHNMHEFVRNNIVRGKWKNKPRPVLVNSWEAAYFKFDEGKLLKLAKASKNAGVELFVVDDGWFGKRNDDKSSLGDWQSNTKKLPGGLKGLCDKIKSIGMKFGIWVEPEMVNVDSNCYLKHPEWAVQIPGKNHSEGRNQRILNLTIPEVRNYVIDEMSKVFSSADITYVKWDMNRIFSDVYSQELNNQKEFFHRYILGLYEVLDSLTKAFPDILFEGCASGGNRFDLGMLCFMPQIWASDNTDAWCRAKIQNGYSYGYPMSVISAHVSDCPNHQTLRNTFLETRFDVSVCAILGYECNIAEMSRDEVSAIKEQIYFYKKYRKKLFDADYYRIVDDGNSYQWAVVSKDKKLSLTVQIQAVASPNSPSAFIGMKGLRDDYRYHFYNRMSKYNIKNFGGLVNAVMPVHIKKDSVAMNILSKAVKMDGEKEDYVLTGRTLKRCGVQLKQNFSGTGFDSDVRFYQDFCSRLYIMEYCGQ